MYGKINPRNTERMINMKKFFVAAIALLMLALMVSCGGDAPDTTLDTEPDALPDIDVIGGNYKLVYDVTDSNAIMIMTDMVGKIESASGVKLPSTNSGNPEGEYEIQFGLKSGRADGEALYNEIAACADDTYGAYSIRALGKKIIIAASDKDALKIAADRFAAMASTVFTVKGDFDETAVFNREKARFGNIELVTDFMTSTELGALTVGGSPVGVVSGKKDYYRALEGKTAIPDLVVKTRYPGASVELTKHTYAYEINITSIDGTRKETYSMQFIDTPKLDSYDLATWTIPYWDGCITYHESVMFVGDEGAPLMYAPEAVLSVRSFDLKTEYVEGVDYEIKDGRIYRLEGSEMPHFTWDEFYPKSKETSVSGNAFAGSEKPYVIFSEGTYFHKNQVFVTYTHAANTDLFVPQRSAKLNKFVEKLEKGESVNLVFFGDSITAGGNSSGWGNTAPFTPRWSEIVRDALAAKYPSAKINFTNTAVGGKETVWGISEIDNSVNKYKPDLLVLAFGMNDGGKSTEQFVANTRTMVDKVLAANPDCEILVVGTMLPHSATTYYKNQDLQEAGLYEMVKSYKSVDVVPMTSVHSSILKHKRYFDMTGNNVNHANDFLIRLYAQTIIRTIVG